MNFKFPFLELHGDLWTSNILIDEHHNEDIYYIDWEHSKEYIMFYDFYCLIWNDVYHKQDNTYFNKYMLGEYDQYFNNVFQIFDIEFEARYRAEYFSIFFFKLS